LYAATKAEFKSAAVIKDTVSALAKVAALPTTILLLGTPLAMISLTDVPGAHPPETLKRPLAGL
jgi:hypothetical protein